jgi:LysM repeat protein
MMRAFAFFSLLLFLPCCSPLRTSPNDEKHQLELTLHAVQTNLDDLRHDINCFQTELQILDGRIKYYENTLASLKQNDLEKQQQKLEALSRQLLQFEKKWEGFEGDHVGALKDLKALAAFTNETTAALAQFKDRIGELEEGMFSQNRKFEELGKLKTSIENLVKGVSCEYKLYKVKLGDSLEKIARTHKTSVEKIKKLNDLQQDLIVTGQQIKIPID